MVEAFADDRGTVWFGTMEHGMASYSRNELAFFPGTEGLIVANITQDAEGRIWFAGMTAQGCDTSIRRWRPRNRHRLDTGDRRDHRPFGYRLGEYPRVSCTRKAMRFVPFHLPFDRSVIDVRHPPGSASLALEDSQGTCGSARTAQARFATRMAPSPPPPGTRAVQQHGERHRGGRPGRIWFICMQAYQPEMTHDGGLCRLEDRP